MTPEQLAARWLADVSRMTCNFNTTDGSEIPPITLLHEAETLAAIARHLAPGDDLVERATAALEGVTEGPWWTEPEGTVRNDADGNPRWDLPRIVRYDETGNTVCKAHLIGGEDPDAALFNARFIAFARQWVPEAAARITALTATVAELTRERDEATTGMFAWVKKAEKDAAEAATLRARLKEANEAGMDEAADKILGWLATAVGGEDYTPIDGTEEWDGDVHGTIYEILKAGKVYDDEDGRVAKLADRDEVVALRDRMARMEGALTFYKNGFQKKTKRSKTGLILSAEYLPTPALLDDCGNRAIDALDALTDGGSNG